MKKLLLAAWLLVCGTMPGFSLNEHWEHWVDISFSFGNTFEIVKKETAYIGAPGVAFNGFTFFQGRLGLFLHGSLLFPAVTYEKNMGNDYTLQGNLLAGPALRLNVSERFTFYGGLGFAGLWIIEHPDLIEEYTRNGLNLGFGGNIGIKYDITGSIYLNFGCTISYTFLNHVKIQSGSDYGLLTVKPYISIGLNYGDTQIDTN